MGKNIWIVPQLRDGKLHRTGGELVSAGQRLAAELDAEVSAVVMGRDVQEAAAQLAGYQLTNVWTLEHPILDGYTPGPFNHALSAAIAEFSPDYLLFAHTYQTVDFMPRLAGEAGGALIPEAVGFEVRDGELVWKRPVFGGKLLSDVLSKGSGPVLVSIQASAFLIDDAESGAAEIRAMTLELDSVTADREILRVEEASGEQVDLSQAVRIVGVGRGIGGADRLPIIEELAAALDAEIAASRPVIDNEWLPRDRQIGSSGQTVAPKLYLAVGISGAIQHLVGMKGSQVIAAINKDRSAPIFSVAQYGIVGDLHEVVPELTKALQQTDTE
jgi:electron transfer flavoprotein alpha subunit